MVNLGLRYFVVIYARVSDRSIPGLRGQPSVGLDDKWLGASSVWIFWRKKLLDLTKTLLQVSYKNKTRSIQSPLHSVELLDALLASVSVEQ